MLLKLSTGEKVFTYQCSNFDKSEYPGNVATRMHQQVIINTAKHKPAIHPIHLTQSKESHVASAEQNSPLHKYFVPKIQLCNDNNM
jgi:hypothetical protein